MNETLPCLLIYTLIPVAAILVGALVALSRTHSDTLVSTFEHFAAGVVFSAVAIELLPRLHELDAPLPMIGGFVAGVLVMMVVKRWLESAGMLVPMAVDLFIDGLLIAIGLAAGRFGGMVLLVGLTIETLSLGLSSTPVLVQRGASKAKAIVLMGGLGIMILLGAGAGFATVGASAPVLAAILGFGVAALLYLVTEELLVEAHQTEDTPLVTATFFLGFLIPLILASV
jgi:ZIP family zinc transporter